VDAIFVGREAELATLDALGHRATTGSPTTVMIEAPAGGGKSALLSRFVACSDRGPMIRISGDEAETVQPYGLYDQLSAELITVTTTVPAGPRAGEDGRLGDLQLRGEELRDHLHAAARRCGFVGVILDDAHLADRASLTTLGYALRRLRSEPILTVVAVRPDGVPGLPQGLLRLADDDAGRMTLDGLTVAEIRGLAAHYGRGELPERAARRLREHTGGNPLHVRALLRDRRLDGVAWLSDPLPAPSSLVRLVAARLARLTPEARDLARAAAVLGLRSDLATAAAAAGIGAPLEAVDELRDAQLAGLQTSMPAAQLVFEHSMFRTAVLQDCREVELSRLHRAAAEHTRGAEALQHRVRASAGFDEELAARLEEQARVDVGRGGWRTAANALLAAASLHPRPDVRDALLVRGVYALLVAGDFAVALSYRERVTALPESARQLQVLALMGWMAGDFRRAEELAERAWRSAADLDVLERDRLAGLLAQMSILQGHGERARSWARTALDSGLLDPDAQASTLATLVGGMILDGEVPAALELLPTDGDLDDAGYRELVGMRGLLQVLSDDPVAAAANLRIRLRPNLADHHRGQSPIELLTATGPDGIEPNKMVVLLFLADAEFRQGHWDVAAAIADQTLGLIEDTEQNWIGPWAHAVAVLVPAARGQWSLAEHHLRRAEQTADQFANELNRGYAANAAVHLAACRGEPERVIDAARWLLASGAPYQQEPGVHCWPVHYAEALVSLGCSTEAEAVLDRWEGAAHRRQHRSRSAALARVRGDLAVRRRDLTGARRWYDTARAVWAQDDAEIDALERTLVQLSYGRFLRRRGERRAAIIELRRAEQRFGQLGAEPYLAQVRSELSACGAELEQLTTASPLVSDLTPQEAAVARLAADGRSNKEIADTLVLSPKTVAYHLGHVYAKLGIRSRSQLVARRLFDPPVT
jgi:ATP/maltotriose-dependent transcriptional regulator MalT